MPTLNETKYAALLNSTGATPPVTLNELEVIWLESKGRSGNLNEMWWQQFEAAGFTGAWPAAATAWLGAFGYLGNINERWYQFWTDGGNVNPVVGGPPYTYNVDDNLGNTGLQGRVALDMSTFNVTHTGADMQDIAINAASLSHGTGGAFDFSANSAAFLSMYSRENMPLISYPLPGPGFCPVRWRD